MGALVLDASAVIALFESGDAHHEAIRATAPGWLRAAARLMPATAYSEAIVAPTRAGVLKRWEADFADLRTEIVPIDAELARIAAQARAARPELRLPDALVIATALAHGAELVTLDRRMLEAHAALAR